MTIPAPISPRPWWQRERVPAVFDATGKIVSFVENADFLIAIEKAHDPLVAALKEMTDAYELAATMLGVPPEEVAQNVGGARGVLAACEPAKASA